MRQATVILALSLVILIPTAASRADAGCSRKQCHICECTEYQKRQKMITSTEQVILFPRNNREYGSCIHSTWNIRIRGSTPLRLHFEKFQLGSGDWVKVYDGPKSQLSLIIRWDSENVPVDVVSSGDRMTLEFKSDNCDEKAGFRASIKLSSCGSLVQVPPGISRTIKSPNFPGLYSSGADCLWTVVGRHRFFSAQIRLPTLVTEASKDIVSIIEPLDDRTTKSKFSGRTQSQTVKITNSPGFSIAFTSDASVTYKGFKIVISGHPEDPSCTQPSSVLNGLVTWGDFRRQYHYSCCPGYKLHGNATKQCIDGQWNPRDQISCQRIASCPALVAPTNGYIVGGKTHPTRVRASVDFKCNLFYEFQGTDLQTIQATCMCTGEWNYSPVGPYCKPLECKSPPPSVPLPGGEVNVRWPYVVGTRAEYKCPKGYGLDGIPYRICTEDGSWEPVTRRHICVANLTTCGDPGIPSNGSRKVLSFADGQLAAFGCKGGFRQEGSHHRTCSASNPNNTYWDGQPTICIDQFKTTPELARQFRETFVDRNVVCIEEADTTESSVALGNDSLPVQASSSGACRGRAVVVGDGCVDLIFAIDCSKSISARNFNLSLQFAARSVALFDITAGQARVALVTYDHKRHPQFNLGDKNTTEATLAGIKAAPYCGGATATGPVLDYIRNHVITKSNGTCKKAVFILTDGQNNWAGDPISKAEDLKAINGVEIYAIAFGSSDLNWNILTRLASQKDYFFPVREPVILRDLIKKTFQLKLNYSDQCGTTSAPDCRARVFGGCHSSKGAWPWIVGIYVRAHGGVNFACGGIIINQCWILTAAHCFQQLGNMHPDDVFIVAGDSLRFEDESTEATYKVCDIKLHQGFNPQTFKNDIMLIKLCCRVDFSNYIRKACLAQSGDEVYYRPGAACFVAGWGGTVQKIGDAIVSLKPSTSLKQAGVPIADINTCKESTLETVADTTFCAGDGTGTTGACRGDSGGPLFCKRKDSDSYVVTGIVSWGIGCGQPGQYGFYTNVLKLRQWIDNEIGQCSNDLCSKPDVILV